MTRDAANADPWVDQSLFGVRATEARSSDCVTDQPHLLYPRFRKHQPGHRDLYLVSLVFEGHGSSGDDVERVRSRQNGNHYDAGLHLSRDPFTLGRWMVYTYMRVQP